MLARLMKRRSTLWLIDGAVTAILIGIVLVMAVPAMRGAERDEAAASILALVSRLQDACTRHHADTSLLALEIAPPTADHHYNARRYHHLSWPQECEGWNGPYIDHAVTRADNPFGGEVVLLVDLDDPPARGFELADGTTASGRGQLLLLTGIPRDVAEAVDRHIDGEGDVAGDWRSTGRVEYSDDAAGSLAILVFRP